MAGGAGAGGAAGSAKPPCCLDNTIIEFRLIEEKVNNNIKFGFDWLRTPQDQVAGITKLENAYVDSDYDNGSVTGILTGGFKKWSREEIARMTEDNPYGGHTDLTAEQAKKVCMGLYRSFKIKRENKFFDYRLKTKRYYIPYLNLMPPIDYILNKNELKALDAVWKVNKPDHIDAAVKTILKSKRIVHATKQSAQKFLSSSRAVDEVIKASKMFAMVRDVSNKATLRMIKDIKVEKPEKLTIEYNPKYLSVSVRGGKRKPSQLPGLTEVLIPKKHYRFTNSTLEEIQNCPVVIKAVAAFSKNQIIKVWAYPKGGEGRRIAGKLIVLANNKVKRTQIALIKVKTSLDGTKSSTRTGAISSEELKTLKYVLNQSLVIPEISEFTLDLTKNKYFKEYAEIEDSNGHKDIVAHSDTLSIYENQAACIYLEKAFHKAVPNHQFYYWAFIFDEEISISGDVSGFCDTNNYFDKAGNLVVIHKPTVYLGSPRLDNALAHEILHAFSLQHVFYSENYSPCLSKTWKLYIRENNNNIGSPEYTTNVLTYGYITYFTWRWQWQIIRSNVNLSKRTYLAKRFGEAEDVVPPEPGTY